MTSVRRKSIPFRDNDPQADQKLDELFEEFRVLRREYVISYRENNRVSRRITKEILDIIEIYKGYLYELLGDINELRDSEIRYYYRYLNRYAKMLEAERRLLLVDMSDEELLLNSLLRNVRMLDDYKNETGNDWKEEGRRRSK